MGGDAKLMLRNGAVRRRGTRERVTGTSSGRFGTLRLLWQQIEDARHTAELGKGTSPHLPHQVGAMDLHGGLGDADIVGNLFVQATGHDVKHDLTLAGGDR